MRIPEALKTALKNGKVIPFVGSGISRAVQQKGIHDRAPVNPLFPSWREYTELLAKALDNRDQSAAANYIRDLLNAKPPDYLGAMQVAFDKLGEADWDKLLDKYFDIEENEADDHSLELARLIWQISSNLIITTNIDRVLQWTCPNPKEFRLLESQKKEFGKLNKENPPKCPTVVYFHGHIDNKANIIFTREQYDHFYNYKNNEAKLETLKVLLAQSTFLFLGFSLDDPYFLEQLKYFHKLYEGGADSFFVLVHKNEKDNPNTPPFVRKLVFEDYGEPLLSLLKQLADIAHSGDIETSAEERHVSIAVQNTTHATNDSIEAADEQSRKTINESSVKGNIGKGNRSSQLNPRTPSSSQSRKPNGTPSAYKVILASLIILSSVGGYLLYRYIAQPAVDAVLIDSIAVLPFQNKNSEPDTDYLSEGLTNELRYSLSQLPNLKVSPKSLAIRYKDKEADPVKTGNELGVRAVLIGRLTQRGDNLDISVELIDVRKDQLKWGKRYNRKLSELLKTQREIAREITQELELKLGGEGEKALGKRYTAQNEAYLLYQKGRFFFAKRTKTDVLRGIEYFKQATIQDENFALAYVGLANAYIATLAYAYVPPEEALPQAKAAALKARDLNPSLAEAHAALAYSIVISDLNWPEAEYEFKRALDLNSKDDEIHFRYGMVYLMTTGRPIDSVEAIEELKRALELEPLSLVNNSILASTYLYGGQYKQALEQAKYAYDLEPAFVLARWNLGYAYIANGKYKDAIELSEESLRTDPTSQFMLRIAGIAYAKSRRKSDAERVINRFKELAKAQYVSSYYVASIYAALGEKDKALTELEHSFAKRDWDLHRLKVDPFMDPLRDDPRFEEMLKRLKLPE